MTLSEKSHGSKENLRWLAWERKNRHEDRIAEKRMKLVFVFAGVILLMLMVYAMTRVRKGPGAVEKGPIVASLGRTDPSRYPLTNSKHLECA